MRAPEPLVSGAFRLPETTLPDVSVVAFMVRDKPLASTVWPA
jgi:hypothetical protein